MHDSHPDDDGRRREKALVCNRTRTRVRLEAWGATVSADWRFEGPHGNRFAVEPVYQAGVLAPARGVSRDGPDLGGNQRIRRHCNLGRTNQV